MQLGWRINKDIVWNFKESTYTDINLCCEDSGHPQPVDHSSVKNRKERFWPRLLCGEKIKSAFRNFPSLLDWTGRAERREDPERGGPGGSLYRAAESSTMLRTDEPRALTNNRSASAAHPGWKVWGQAAVSPLGVFSLIATVAAALQLTLTRRKIPGREWP